MRTTKGFTLFELLIVMTIVAITSAIVLPSAAKFMVNSRINAAAEQLTGLLMSARTMAATRQRPVFITRKTSALGDVYSLQMNTTIAASPILASYLAPSGTTTVITRIPAVDSVVYQPAGLLQRTDTNAALDWVIQICDSSVRTERGRVVQASRMGRLSNRVNTLTTICFAN